MTTTEGSRKAMVMSPYAIELPIVPVMPVDHRRSPTLRAHAAMLAGVGLDVGEDGGVDFEDSIELAARTQAALAIPGFGGGRLVAFADGRSGPIALDDLDAPLDGCPIRVLASMDGARRLTRQAGRAPLLDNEAPYWHSAAFVAHAGRRITVCRNCDEDEVKPRWAARPYLYDVIGDLAKEDPSRPLVHKFVGSGLKRYAPTFSTTRHLREDLGYDVVDNWMGGSLIQDAVAMTYEYRFLLVDWVVVGGSGTVPQLTADQAIPRADGLDDRMKRTATSVVESRPDILSGHRRFAESAVAALREEGLLSGTMTLDVFKTDGDEVRGIVETNPIGMAGWFAADPTRVMTAVDRLLRRGAAA